MRGSRLTELKGEGMESVVAELYEMQDCAYRSFQAALIPTVDPARVIGVRTPQLRAYARRFVRDQRVGDFLAELPHRYYEENNLHGELLNLTPARTEVNALLKQLDAFLPHVDNWATCDTLAPKVLARHPEETVSYVRSCWLSSGRTYTVRFGIDVLMRWYLDERFDPAHLHLVAGLPCGDYYIDMARAWYFSVALVKQWEVTLPLFKSGARALDPWTHNKALQKARESRRVPLERKAYLQSLKVPVPTGAAPIQQGMDGGAADGRMPGRPRCETNG